MTKQELRTLFLKKRAALNEAEFLHLNRNLCDQFFSSIDLSFLHVVHCFLPIPDKKEPDTWLIIDRLQREYPNIRIAIPKVNAITNELDHFLFEGIGKLKSSKWGVPEPTEGVPVPIEKIDLVLVPLLAFDATGHRIGYGKGYYDRFLATCRASTLRIGLSLFDPVPVIESAQNDVKLTGCITPFQFFRFAS